jgi:hypothetical protein
MINFVLNILFQLKDLPGFRFLGPYYARLFSKVQQVLDKKGDMEEAVGGALTGVKVVKNIPKQARSAKGSKKRS